MSQDPAHTLRVLGEPVWVGADGPLRVRSRKGLALLCYLACQPRQEVSRRQLGAMLWGDFDRSQAAASLATTLSRLKRQTPVWPLADRGDYLWWEPARGVDTDAEWFHAGIRQRTALPDLARLIRGPFLAGLELDDAPGYMEWLVAERRQWHGRYLDVLWGATVEARDREDWRAVLEWSRQALYLDPLQERFVRAMMLAHTALGDRGAARAVYDQLVRHLSQQLLGRPEPATAQLRDKLLQGTVVALAREPEVRVPTDGLRSAGRGLPFVGRAALVERVRTHVAGRGPAPVLLLAGPFGIGKTRLLAEALANRRVVWAKGDWAWRRDAWFPWNVWMEQVTWDGDWMTANPSELASQLAAARARGEPLALVLDDADRLDLRAWLRLATVLRAPHRGAVPPMPVILALDPTAARPAVRGICRAWVADRWAYWVEVPPLAPSEVEQLGMASRWRASSQGAPWDAVVHYTGGIPLLLMSQLGTAQERARAEALVADWLDGWPPSVRTVWEAAAVASGELQVNWLFRLSGVRPSLMLAAIDRATGTGWLREVVRDDAVWLEWTAPALADLVRRSLSATRQDYWRQRLARPGADG